jgi:hypothetical protein
MNNLLSKVLLIICMVSFCIESTAETQNYAVPDNSPTATLQLSSNVGNVTVKVFGNRDCEPNPDGTLLTRLKGQNDFSNPVLKDIHADSEIVITFYYSKRTLMSHDFCPVTERFTPFADKRYHIHFVFKEGWCELEVLTLVDEGAENEHWDKYLFAKPNRNVCLEESDMQLLRQRRIR